MQLTILSPERKLVDRLEVAEVTVPGSEGQVQILEGHTSMMGTLETGPFHYRSTQGDEVKGAISTGFFEIRGSHVILMAETLETATEIDTARAKSAQDKAQKALEDSAITPDELVKQQRKLARAFIRQHVVS